MRELLPAPDEQSTPDDLVRRAYDHPGPLVRWNMISTLDGSVVGPDGRSGTINNGADHRVFGFLRAWADVVIVGAGTVRAEGYSALRPNRWRSLREGRRPAPVLAVVSRQSSLPPSLAGSAEEDVILFGGDDVSPAAVLEDLRARGHRRILLEGGPHLAGSFVDAGLLDELCLTLAPSLVGGDGGRITAGPHLAAGATLASLLEEDGTLLSRWRLTHDEVTSPTQH